MPRPAFVNLVLLGEVVIVARVNQLATLTGQGWQPLLPPDHLSTPDHQAAEDRFSKVLVQTASAMALNRLKQFAAQITGLAGHPHPFDPLSSAEIEKAVGIVRLERDDALFFNTVTLWEPRKAEMTAWLADPETRPRPRRVADVVVIGAGSKVFDGLVDLEDGKIIQWELTEGVQPLVRVFHVVSRPSL